MVNAGGKQRPENLEQWGRVAREIAKAGLPMHAHTTLENSFDGFLDQIEKINKEFPVRNLRWSLIHGEQLNASHLARIRELGMHVAIQPRATIMGGIFNRVHGDRSYDMPPLRTIQESGVAWGFGTDTFEVNQYRPLTTLYFAVTGKMVGGTVVNRQPISREDALIAHTRGSAFTSCRRATSARSSREARRPGRARSRLPDRSGGPDQGHPGGDDDGRRAGRLRGLGEIAPAACRDRNVDRLFGMLTAASVTAIWRSAKPAWLNRLSIRRRPVQLCQLRDDYGFAPAIRRPLSPPH